MIEDVPQIDEIHLLVTPEELDLLIASTTLAAATLGGHGADPLNAHLLDLRLRWHREQWARAAHPSAGGQ